MSKNIVNDSSSSVEDSYESNLTSEEDNVSEEDDSEDFDVETIISKANERIYKTEEFSDNKVKNKLLLLEKMTKNDKSLERDLHLANYNFKYYAVSKTFCENTLKLRGETIFKYNWMRFIMKLQRYLQKTDIEIYLFFEVSSKLESKIKKNNGTFKHDVYIVIKNKNNNKEYFDIAFEFYEKKAHLNNKDEDKETSSMVLLDEYKYYKEEAKNVVRLDRFMKESVYLIMRLVCASLQDHILLTKINYFKNMSKEQIDDLLPDFEFILNIYKKQNFEPEKLLEVFRLFNNNKIITSKKELIIYLKKIFELEENDKIIYDFNTFKKFIILHYTLLPKAVSYNNLINNAYDLMISSQKEILVLISNKNYLTKYNLPKFIKFYLKDHVHKFGDEKALILAYENLTNHFSNTKSLEQKTIEKLYDCYDILSDKINRLDKINLVK